VHFWFERKIPERAEANVDQSECGMIDADVTAAFGLNGKFRSAPRLM